MPRAIRIHEVGGPEVMRLEDVDVAAPARGEVQIRHTAIGVNFIDVYDRNGLYPQKSLPGSLGREAAGVITAVGRRTVRCRKRRTASESGTTSKWRARYSSCSRKARSSRKHQSGTASGEVTTAWYMSMVTRWRGISRCASGGRRVAASARWTAPWIRPDTTAARQEAVCERPSGRDPRGYPCDWSLP